MAVKQILIKQGPKSRLPTLASGELGFCTDTKELFMGTAFSSNFLVNEKIQVNITYAKLKQLRDSSNLTAGTKYRITDYETTTVQADTRSAGNLFDIIVQALDKKTVSENAFAIKSSRDTYFDNSELDTWELKYCLDNDTARFAWADEVNGKGVIYYMKDEHNNEVPYDFKNIQFKRSLFKHKWGTLTFANRYFYTFSAYSYALATGAQGDIKDATIIMKQEIIARHFNRCHSNVIKPLIINYAETMDVPTSELNDTIFVNTYASDDQNGEGVYFICHSNNLGYNCYSNTIGDGSHSNTIGNDFYSNTIGYSFHSNTIGNGFYSNTIGYNFHSNAIGNNYYLNTIGNSYYNNTIGNSFYYNTIGDSFFSNTIEYGFYSNVIRYGFYNNTVGYNFYSNIIGNNFMSNDIGNDIKFITFSLDGTNQNRIRYLHLKNGLMGSSAMNRLNLYYDGLYGREYPTTFELIANGNVISSWEATPSVRAAKVKETITTATWSDTLEIISSTNMGIKFWTGTQAEYDSLSEKDEDTLYFIEEE